MRHAFFLSAIFGALMGSMPVAARDLAVPKTASWQHALTGLILSSRYGDLSRTVLADTGNNELDVYAEFMSPDEKTSLTIYLFRPALMSVPVWFDRSETQILMRDAYHGAQPAAPVPVAFVRPGATKQDSLRQTYRPGKGPYLSTGLTVMPMGKWLVAIRLSSQTMDTTANDTMMYEIATKMRWPAGIAAGPEATPVASCKNALKYSNARMIQPDMMQALLGATMQTAAVQKEKPEEPPAVFCRDGTATKDYGVYRADNSTRNYTLAVADAGRTIQVSPLLIGEGYQVTLHDLDRVSVYPSFDKLPYPARALEMVNSKAPISTVTGKDTTISMPSK